MRAVLDPNVIISALLSPDGSPALAMRAWIQGEFELIVSPLLLEELERALAYPKLRKRIEQSESSWLVSWLGEAAIIAPDPDAPPSISSVDRGDDYLISLAEAERAALVSGDDHLLRLAATLPIYTPADFVSLLQEKSSPSS